MAKTLDEAGVKRLIQEIKGANKNLNAPIPISTENTPESKAQNVKNIADYVEKAKVAGIANVDGMGATCLIDNDYSGVGYLYGDTAICGIKTNDALEAPSFFDVDPSGSYHEGEVLVKGLSDQITSDMLVEGARKPIIFTPETTEVDEETYQKLLSDDVDVVFKAVGGTLCGLTYTTENNDNLELVFSCFSVEGETDMDIYIYGYDVSITKNSPHTCSINEQSNNDFISFLATAGYLKKSTLNPVLQEIDLRGTDAERKAKLDKFETDWKALTGANDLAGARFVGCVDNTDNSGSCSVLFTFDHGTNVLYQGCVMASDTDKKIVRYTLDKNDGSLVLTPLFSHLEAITIKIGSTPENKAANVAAIQAYIDNLTALGVDVTKGFMIPVKTDNGNGFILFDGTKGSGYVKMRNDCYGISIEKDYSCSPINLMSTSTSYGSLKTTSKRVLPAINEVNALAKGYSTIFIPIELTTETAQNKTAIDARVAAFTAQGISLTNGCCIPVTYKGVYAGNISLINGDWYGLLVKNTNNPADNINIKLSADGTITEGNSAQ